MWKPAEFLRKEPVSFTFLLDEDRSGAFISPEKVVGRRTTDHIQAHAGQTVPTLLGIWPEKSPTIDNPGGWLDSGVDGRFTGTIRLGCSEGLFALVIMNASPFCNCVFTELNRIGDAHKKRGSQWPRVRRASPWRGGLRLRCEHLSY
jgi:hypothetical protein